MSNKVWESSPWEIPEELDLFPNLPLELRWENKEEFFDKQLEISKYLLKHNSIKSQTPIHVRGELRAEDIHPRAVFHFHEEPLSKKRMDRIKQLVNKVYPDAGVLTTDKDQLSCFFMSKYHFDERMAFEVITTLVDLYESKKAIEEGNEEYKTIWKNY